HVEIDRDADDAQDLHGAADTQESGELEYRKGLADGLHAEVETCHHMHVGADDDEIDGDVASDLDRALDLLDSPGGERKGEKAAPADHRQRDQERVVAIGEAE